MQDGIRLRETDGWMDRRCSLKAMPDPEPAKMKMSMEMNSETAALAVSGCDSSPGAPTAILLTGIMVCERVVVRVAGRCVDCKERWSCMLLVHPLAKSVAAAQLYIVPGGMGCTRNRDWRLAVRGPTKDGMEWDAIQADAGSKIGGSGRINCRWRHARPLSIRTK